MVLTLPMEVKRVRAHPKVWMNAGRVAIQRGPVVYCLEQTDNGTNLDGLALRRKSNMSTAMAPDLLDGVVVVRGSARRQSVPMWRGHLYRDKRGKRKQVKFKAVPYYAWCNRKPGEMIVWVPAP